MSPGWYPSKEETGKVVPTWNYIVVHAYGPMRAVEDPVWLRGQLEELTNRQEVGRKEPWQVSDSPVEYTERLMRAIVGIEIPITRLLGKWKVSQNRSLADREGVAEGLRREGTESAAAIANLVRGVAPKPAG